MHQVTSITIHGIDEDMEACLRAQAAKHGRSMEEEARDILHTMLSCETARLPTLADAIRACIEPFSGVELEIAPREPMPESFNLDE